MGEHVFPQYQADHKTVTRKLKPFRLQRRDKGPP
jgi:hypothetical protein